MPIPSVPRGKRTFTVGTVLAVLGGVFAFIQGVDWSVIFSPEGAAVAGAGVVFGRAIVAFFQAVDAREHE